MPYSLSLSLSSHSLARLSLASLSRPTLTALLPTLTLSLAHTLTLSFDPLLPSLLLSPHSFTSLSLSLHSLPLSTLTLSHLSSTTFTISLSDTLSPHSLSSSLAALILSLAPLSPSLLPQSHPLSRPTLTPLSFSRPTLTLSRPYSHPLSRFNLTPHSYLSLSPLLSPSLSLARLSPFRPTLSYHSQPLAPTLTLSRPILTISHPTLIPLFRPYSHPLSRPTLTLLPYYFIPLSPFRHTLSRHTHLAPLSRSFSLAPLTPSISSHSDPSLSHA